MREYRLKCLADFARVGSPEVEAFLTDLAVDGSPLDLLQLSIQPIAPLTGEELGPAGVAGGH
jgi:hypothetical protein